MKEAQGAKEQRRNVVWSAYEKFLELHSGAVPPWLAAEYLRMTPQGVFQASERGWITYFQHGRNRLYSRKDLINYRFAVSRKFHDNKPVPPNKPGEAAFEVAYCPERRKVIRIRKNEGGVSS